jgi:glycerate-2-kinase
MRTLSCARLTSTVLAWAVFASGPTVTGQSGHERYVALLDEYRSGETTASVQKLLTLGREGLGLAADAQGSNRGMAAERARMMFVRAQLVPVAAMLHTDAAEVLWSMNRGGAREHFEIATKWVDVRELEASPFRRRWYLAAGCSSARSKPGATRSGRGFSGRGTTSLDKRGGFPRLVHGAASRRDCGASDRFRIGWWH